MTPLPGLNERLNLAMQFEQSNEVLQAELLYIDILKDWPQSVDAATQLARLALKRGDASRAVHFLEPTVQLHPTLEQPAVDLAVAYLAAGRPHEAVATLERSLLRAPQFFVAWLLLGNLREAESDAPGAIKAWIQALTLARRAGVWRDPQSTPSSLQGAVRHAVGKLREARRQLLFASFEDLRQEHGGAALARVDRALAGYLREWGATPLDPRQRPRFFFFPGLPNQPYHDPFLQPWASRLQAAFTAIRAEAVQLLAEDRPFQNFIDFREGVQPQDYLKGHGFDPVWEAFFFYRHGERFDANHARCPKTSEMLESIDLCRIAGDAPEICFSVLRPGSEILPHHGVTNVRLVVHLPLVVPEDCALNLIGAETHRWQEGSLVMFDDTFQHEAWNRSSATRVVLLMDCWNPHLTPVERRAVKQLIETIGALSVASRSHEAARYGG